MQRGTTASRAGAVRVGLLLGLLLGAAPARAGERLLFALVESGAHVLYAYDPATGQSARVFSDAAAALKLQARGGARDSVGVLRADGATVVALGQGTEAAGAPALYQLCLDGSNTARRIGTVQSAAPLERLALDARAQRVAYPALQPDPTFRGEGNAPRVGELVVQDLRTGEVQRHVPLWRTPRPVRIPFLGWAASGDALYLQVQGEPARAGVYAVQRGAPARLPVKLGALERLSAVSTRGELFVTTVGSARFALLDRKGKRLRTGSFAKDRGGWHFALSPQADRVALQNGPGELWLQGLDGRTEARVPVPPGQPETLTLVGWADEQALKPQGCGGH